MGMPTPQQDLQALGLLVACNLLGSSLTTHYLRDGFHAWAAGLGGRIMANIGSFSAGNWQPADINTAIMLALMTAPGDDDAAWQRVAMLRTSPGGWVAEAALVSAVACVCSGMPGHPTTTPTAVWLQLAQLLESAQVYALGHTTHHLPGAHSTSPTQRKARTSGGRQVSAARVCRAASMPNAAAPAGCDHRQPPLLVKSISAPGEGRPAAAPTGRRSGAGRRLSSGRCKA